MIRSITIQFRFNVSPKEKDQNKNNFIPTHVMSFQVGKKNDYIIGKIDSSGAA